MESRMRDLKPSLEIGLGGVCMIGIWGMGGAGKTTLARALFGDISHQFDGSVFVENVREVSEKNGLNELQNQILYAINKYLKVNSVHHGIELIRTRLCKKKILIVLDDVDDITQLKALAGEPSWFGDGSRIIITTRDSQLLQAHHVDKIHNVSLLNEKEALLLFCNSAFKSNIPGKGYEDCSKEVVSYAAGLPLTLKVLGPLFSGRDLPFWSSALEKLKEVPEKKILKILEISYHSLDDYQKAMFLDIACFYTGMHINLLSVMLDCCGYFATADLVVLQQKSLISFSNEKHCQVHDLVVEMAQDIVRRDHPKDPWKHSRLWRPEEVLDVLNNNKGTEKIKSLVVNMFGVEDDVNISEAFRNMNLILLHVSNASKLTFKGPNYLPETLQVLHFENYPLEYLPNTFQGRNLVKLELIGRHICGLRMPNVKKGFKKLKFLTIEGSKKIETTPDFTSMSILEGVVIRHCPNVLEIHPSIGSLKKLKSLELYSLGKLIELPPSIGRLHNLVLLDLRFCTSLVTLPDTISQLECLQTLNLKFCINLAELPYNLGIGGGLACLHTLDIQKCLRLHQLPSNLGFLPLLENLLLREFPLKELPNSICSSNSLKSLVLSKLEDLRCLPIALGQIKYLEKLVLKECPKIEHLPNSTCQLRCLKTLVLDTCLGLKELPLNLDRIVCLEELCIKKSNIILPQHSIRRLKHLRSLRLTHCHKLKEFPIGVYNIQSLVQSSREMLWKEFPSEMFVDAW